MFVVLVHYKTSLEMIDKYVAPHRAFLREGYEKNYFIAAGPLNPRTGGLILSQLKDRNELENILTQDPLLSQKNLVDYEITEFKPTTYHSDFEKFVL